MPIERPYLRDGIDVYVRGDSELHLVYLATRKRVVLKVEPHLIQALSWLDGQHLVEDLRARMSASNGPLAEGHLVEFLAYLERSGVVVEQSWALSLGLPPEIVERQQRQLEFLLDILGTPERVARAQEQIRKAKIVCFGVGAVGSWILRQLLGMGFRQFVLVDYDVAAPEDVARHAFAFDSFDGSHEFKVRLIQRSAVADFPDAVIESIARPLNTSAPLDDLIGPDTTLVINAADEPYIGYTSVLLSRFCVKRNLPLLVAGGFDAHLASLGEVIVPGVTPCGDCYADFFQDALADWKPIEHPVGERVEGFGGLCSLSVFSAAAGAMKILRYVALGGEPEAGRGELLFEDYRVENFQVAKRADCPTCGGS